MVSLTWGIFILLAIVFSLFSGNIEALNNEIVTSGTSALEMILTILPVLVIWMGLMKIAEDSGLLRKMAKKAEPILGKLFPSVPKGNPAIGYIASNVIVNMMGLGSAATPFGLKAMQELQKINTKKNTASPAMITFLVLNTGGVTIIPTTIISLRAMHGSANPTEVIVTAVLATLCAAVSGLVLDAIIRKRKRI